MTQATDPFTSAFPSSTSSPKKVVWSYGITTVPERKETTLPYTFRSLHSSGFVNPTLFADGEADRRDYHWQFCTSDVVCRSTRLGPFLNWVLALWELYGREPHADLYAIFQDDIIVSRNLRAYLERTLLDSSGQVDREGYYNLFTSVGCHDYWDKRKVLTPPYGWVESAQLGWGACALVFDREAVMELLSNRELIRKPTSLSIKERSYKIDGIVSDVLTARGRPSEVDMEDWHEWVHLPSLVQHVGEVSTIGHPRFSPAPSFRGESFDLMTLLKDRGGERKERR